MPDPRVAEIVKGLSEAEKRELLADQQFVEDMLVADLLYAKSLCTLIGRLTPLGLQVAAALREMKDA